MVSLLHMRQDSFTEEEDGCKTFAHLQEASSVQGKPLGNVPFVHFLYSLGHVSYASFCGVGMIEVLYKFAALKTPVRMTYQI